MSEHNDRPLTPREIRAKRSGDHLREVADLYRQFLEAGETAPAKQIAEKFGADPNTVRTWIFRARRAGFIGHIQLPPRKCPTCNGTGEVPTRFTGSRYRERAT